MSKWRVIEHGAKSFEVQRKGLLFWGSCHSPILSMAPSKPLFRSLDEALAYIAQMKTAPSVVHEE